MAAGVKPTRIELEGWAIPDELSVDATYSGDDADWDEAPGVGGQDQWKQPCRAATTANITIATALNAADTLDGVTLAAGDRVLVKDQTAAAENGIYVVGTTPARAADMDETEEVLGAVVYVIAGTTNAGTAWAVTTTTAVTIDTDAIDWAAFGGGAAPGASITEAADVPARADVSGAGSLDVQGQLDELYGAVAWYAPTPGAITPDGSPVDVVNDSAFNGFPGLARLDESRVLLVYRAGTGHLTAGSIMGMIGTLAADRASVASWGTAFTIEDLANDLRCDDAVSVIGGTVYIAAREYDGSVNLSSHILVCDDAATDLSASSTWTRYEGPTWDGTTQNLPTGYVVRLADGTYGVAVIKETSGTFTAGFAVVTDPTDWSTPTFTTIAAGYTEVGLVVMPDGEVRAHLRNTASNAHYESHSTDDGATWSTPASVFTADGFPMFRRLLSGQLLTVYRKSPNTDTEWRVSSDGTESGWGTATVLDTTGTRSEYATLLQLTQGAILCAYGIYNSSSDADIRTQVFTDASVFEGAAGVTDHGALAGLADDDHTQYLLRSVLTTRGDLFRRGASAIERVALGTSGQVLTSDGTDAVWADAAAAAGGHYEVIVSGSAPPVAVTNEAEDDWLVGWVED